MYRKKFILLFLAATAVLQADQAADIQKIDNQIQELQEQKRQCQLQARLASQHADRVMSQDWLAYRREIQRHDMMAERAEQIDAEISQLAQQKQQLLLNKSGR